MGYKGFRRIFLIDPPPIVATEKSPSALNRHGSPGAPKPSLRQRCPGHAPRLPAAIRLKGPIMELNRKKGDTGGFD